jgi:hypothetical protein
LAFSRERLPLLHRLWAGIAKVKVKIKAREAHGFLRFENKFWIHSAANQGIWQVPIGYRARNLENSTRFIPGAPLLPCAESTHAETRARGIPYNGGREKLSQSASAA